MNLYFYFVIKWQMTIHTLTGNIRENCFTRKSKFTNDSRGVWNSASLCFSRSTSAFWRVVFFFHSNQEKKTFEGRNLLHAKNWQVLNVKRKHCQCHKICRLQTDVLFTPVDQDDKRQQENVPTFAFDICGNDTFDMLFVACTRWLERFLHTIIQLLWSNAKGSRRLKRRLKRHTSPFSFATSTWTSSEQCATYTFEQIWITFWSGRWARWRLWKRILPPMVWRSWHRVLQIEFSNIFIICAWVYIWAHQLKICCVRSAGQSQSPRKTFLACCTKTSTDIHFHCSKLSRATWEQVQCDAPIHAATASRTRHL